MRFRNTLLLAVLAATTLLVGCDQQDASEPFVNPYVESVGARHNVAMEQALNTIRQRYTPAQVRELVGGQRSGAFQLAATLATPYLINDAQLSQRTISEGLQSARAYWQDGAYKSLADMYTDDNVSPRLSSYLSEIDSALSIDQSADQYRTMLANVEQRAHNDDGLADSELQAVLVGTAVAAASYAYWSEHFDEWQVAVGGPNSSPSGYAAGKSQKMPPWMQEVVKADVTAGVSGAILGAISAECTASGIGGGPLVWVGCVGAHGLTAAAAGSIGAAVWEAL